MNRRRTIGILGQGSLTALFPPVFSLRRSYPSVNLTEVREQVCNHFESIRLPNQPYGAYGNLGQTDLYASCDAAIARYIMGENLKKTLSPSQRREWVSYINSYQQPADGSYTERFNHSEFHANGMTVGALGILVGRQKYPVMLYEAFDTVKKVVPWLEQINWAKQWGASHLFWGGIHCYSLSKRCTSKWLDTVFRWLNRNLDEQTGWWRKGTVYTDRHQPLGGSVHILPLYQHHHREFPYPERVIDSTLALQLPNGRWLNRAKDQAHVMHYLELDALYALYYMSYQTEGYRKSDIIASVNKYADLVCAYWSNPVSGWEQQHPHRILSLVGTFGLLQKLLPERFEDQRTWSDIFSDLQLYNTAAVEAINTKQ